MILENYLRNFSFISLFLTMLLYWTKSYFFQVKKTNIVENITIFSCSILLFLILLIRWIDSNHFPLSNLYESLIFLSWSLLIILLILQLKTKELFLGTILTPIILFINTFATFSLPKDMQKVSSLVPALQSNWLMMHVTIMMLSYAALICGSLLAITLLVITIVSKKLDNETKKKNSQIFFSLNSIFIKKRTVFPSSTYLSASHSSSEININPEIESNESDLNTKYSIKKINLITKLDNLSYRTIGIGFPLLTIGILSGAVWANETWGSYWSWDPKETWALITWIVYAIYLHSRIIKGLEGKKPALIASFGFLTVWVCYLGVNIFGKGLHSYGWFSNIS